MEIIVGARASFAYAAWNRFRTFSSASSLGPAAAHRLREWGGVVFVALAGTEHDAANQGLRPLLQKHGRLGFILMHAWLAWPKVDAFHQGGLRVGDLEPHVVRHWPVAPRGRCCRGTSRRVISSHVSPKPLGPCPVQLGVGVAKTMLDVLHRVHTIGHRRLGSWRVCCGDLTRKCSRKELWNTRFKPRCCSAFWISSIEHVLLGH